MVTSIKSTPSHTRVERVLGWSFAGLVIMLGWMRNPRDMPHHVCSDGTLSRSRSY
jgi:hypothetical protein